ncbi:DUF732 domain-containing protein [Mycobacterium sherrisii]|uniref:DUF732 domain-containing protein n=1 Tax=Mycobacterium sherrisii TaxID=243061 RepID=A0A1E3T9M3_9MYCO|nr:DUF732 domain-containing protein [Mycobacterium sherrisii]MCV7031634.1 DUF732 domain-containing protein [Mycobacterium sherrisii]MEC4764981.1 DUF732 domain-containing protein [Mycobacterium sherrisii]ODR11005.1 hypothetical protein BHQ21_01185 [Mycobacterium sherrisii]ORW86097.1 hypothetical protein AWC25_21465 [Mycobacterium sherrisii]
MPAPLWLARLAAPFLIGTALVTTAAVAAADAVDDGFLVKMRGLGFSWPPNEDNDIILMAHHICADRWNAWSSQQIADDVHNTLGPRGVSFGDVAAMVNLAVATYCP